MALVPFRVDAGLDIDGNIYLLAGSGVPGGTTDTDAGGVGSRYTDTATGNFYTKVTAGAGTDKWSQMASTSYVDSALASTVSWREPVLVHDSGSTTLPTETPGNPTTIDGITVNDGDRVLFSAIVGGDGKNVYIYDQATGTFVEDTNAETENDTLFVNDGTDAGKQFVYNGTDWVQSNQTTLDELGFIRAFIGKTGAGNELPTYSSVVYVANNDSLETAIGKLDAAIAALTATDIDYVNTTSGMTATNVQTAIDELDSRLDALEGAQTTDLANAGGTPAVIESVLVDDVAAITWHVHLRDTTTDDVEFVIISAIHDGSADGTTDATTATFNISSKLRDSNVLGDVVEVVLNGTGAAQEMRLQVTATNIFDVRSLKAEIINW